MVIASQVSWVHNLNVFIHRLNNGQCASKVSADAVGASLVYLLPVFVGVVGRIDVSASMGAEAESVDSESVSLRNLEGGFGGKLWVVWVYVDV